MRISPQRLFASVLLVAACSHDSLPVASLPHRPTQDLFPQAISAGAGCDAGRYDTNVAAPDGTVFFLGCWGSPDIDPRAIGAPHGKVVRGH